MESFQLEAEIKELDLGQIYFRAIDRIQALSFKDYQKEENKLFDFSWSVKMFKASIPDEKTDTKFKEDFKKWQSKNVSGFKNEFDHWMDLFSMCIDLLSRNGILYRRVKYGTY